jgi:hypothetical protein
MRRVREAAELLVDQDEGLDYLNSRVWRHRIEKGETRGCAKLYGEVVTGL